MRTQSLLLLAVMLMSFAVYAQSNIVELTDDNFKE